MRFSVAVQKEQVLECRSEFICICIYVYMSVECATTQHNIPRDLSLQAYRCENLKSEI